VDILVKYLYPPRNLRGASGSKVFSKNGIIEILSGQKVKMSLAMEGL